MRQTQLAELRQSSWSVDIYDINSTVDTIGFIVRDLLLQPLAQPRNFSEDIKTVKVNEQAGDYASNAIAATSLTITVVDFSDRFNPLDYQGNPTGDARWIRRGNVVRLREGDVRVSAEFWPITFTGLIVGQPGVVRNRDGKGTMTVTFKCVSREVGFLQYLKTSDVFGKGTAYIDMIEDIAQNEMGLDIDEIDLPVIGTSTTGLVSTQFVEQSPIVSIAQIMFPDGFVPKFTGEGKLGASQGSITQAPKWIYNNDRMFRAINVPDTQINPTNVVTILGLDKEMSKVRQPRQLLAEVRITTGFFSSSDGEEVFWSEDRTILADDVQFSILKSVNGGIGGTLGDDEFAEFIQTPLQPPDGTIGARIIFSTGFSSGLMTLAAVGYIAESFIPDGVLAFLGGSTISIGRAIQAVTLVAIQQVMSRLGTGEYEFNGCPYEMVFQEIKGEARIEGILSFEANELEIENHLINTQALADDVARDVLFGEQAEGNPRDITMLHDLQLEVDDVFELGSNDRRYLIKSISRTLERKNGTVFATVDALEVTAGLVP